MIDDDACDPVIHNPYDTTYCTFNYVFTVTIWPITPKSNTDRTIGLPQR